MRTRITGLLRGLALAIFVAMPTLVLAADSLPTGKAIKLSDIVTLIGDLGTKLAEVAGIIVVAVMIWAGIMMATAGGDDKRYAKGKTMLWQAMIGLVVILGIGVIVSTIKSFATDPTQITR